MQLGAGHIVGALVTIVAGVLIAQYLVNNVSSVRRTVGGL